MDSGAQQFQHFQQRTSTFDLESSSEELVIPQFQWFTQQIRSDEQRQTAVEQPPPSSDIWASWTSTTGSQIADISGAQTFGAENLVTELPAAAVGINSLLQSRTNSSLGPNGIPLLPVHPRPIRRACAACRKQKSACDQNEQRPCTRCKRLGRTCVDTTAEKSTPNTNSVRGKKRKHGEEKEQQGEQSHIPLDQADSDFRPPPSIPKIASDSEIFSKQLLSTLELLQVWETVWRVHCSVVELPARIVGALGWHRQVSHLFLLISDMLLQADFDTWIQRHTATLRTTRMWKFSPFAPWADRNTTPMHLAWGLEDTADVASDAPGRVRDSEGDSILSPILNCGACGSGVESAQLRLEFCASGKAVFLAQEAAWLTQLEHRQRLILEKANAIPAVDTATQSSKCLQMDSLLQQAAVQEVQLRLRSIHTATREAQGQVGSDFCQVCTVRSRGTSKAASLSSKGGRSTAATEWSTPSSAVSIVFTPPDSNTSDRDASSFIHTPPIIPQQLQLEASMPSPHAGPPLLVSLDCVTHLSVSLPNLSKEPIVSVSTDAQLNRELISPAHASWCPMSSSEMAWRRLVTAEDIAQGFAVNSGQLTAVGCLCESSSPVLARLCQNSSMSAALGRSTSAVIRMMMASGAQGCRRFVAREQWGDVLLRQVQQWKACINVIADIAQQVRSTYVSPTEQEMRLDSSSDRSSPKCSAWSHLHTVSPVGIITPISMSSVPAVSEASTSRCRCPACSECSALCLTFARTHLISTREYEEGVLMASVADISTQQQHGGHSSAASCRSKCHLVRIHTQAGLV